MLLPEVVWSSVLGDVAEKMNSHDLLLGYGIVFAPIHYHFTVIALAVDRGRSSRGDILQTNLLQGWSPMTIPCSKLFSTNYSTASIGGDYMTVGVSRLVMGVAKTPEQNNLLRPHTSAILFERHIY